MRSFPTYLYFLPILLIFSASELNSQPLPTKYKLRVAYKMEYQKDSANPKTKMDEFMQLYIGDTSSLFESFNYGLADSAISSEKGKNNSMGPSIGFLSSIRTSFMYLIQKQQNAIITYDEIGAYDYYYYREDRNLFNWKILEDTANIGGISCQKAETDFGGRKWEAWFAPEIPISDGPYKFCGLPGLILQISDTRNFWNFSLASISNIDTIIAPTLNNHKPKKIKDKATFFKELKSYNDNLIDIEVARHNLSFSSDAEKERNKRIRKERRKHDNNWIELYDSAKN